MRELRRFLGMINFYRRVIPNAGKILAQLEQTLSPKKRSNKEIAWGHESEQAFNLANEKLADATALAFPIKGGKTLLLVDASNTAVGAVLQQTIDAVA